LQDFNVQLLCYWGLMCLINGRSDTLSISWVSWGFLPFLYPKNPKDFCSDSEWRMAGNTTSWCEINQLDPAGWKAPLTWSSWLTFWPLNWLNSKCVVE
jgi:hypothetical protein